MAFYAYAMSADEYENINADLSTASGALSTNAGMSPAYDVVADSSHVYSAHGTTLARISASGTIQTLAVPDVRRITASDSHIYGASTSSSGQLVVVGKTSFTSYSTVAINVGSGATYANSLDGIAVDSSGDVWVVGRRTGISFGGVRIAKYDVNAGTWPSIYTVTNSYVVGGSAVGYPLSLATHDAYLSTHRLGGNGRLFRLSLSDGSELASINLSGFPSRRLYVHQGDLYEQNNTLLEKRNASTLTSSATQSFSDGGTGQQACNNCAFVDSSAYGVNGASDPSGRLITQIELATMSEGATLTINTKCDTLASIVASAISGIFVGAVVF